MSASTNGQDRDTNRDTNRITKSFPVFDCDAHINDPDAIWRDYVEPEYRELVRQSYWKDEHQTILNGRTPVIGGASHDFPGYNPICLAGPQMSKKIARKLQQIGLTPEQRKYVEHQGAYDPKRGVKEMDSWGSISDDHPENDGRPFPFWRTSTRPTFTRAYNNWAHDYAPPARPPLPCRWLPRRHLHTTRSSSAPKSGFPLRAHRRSTRAAGIALHLSRRSAGRRPTQDRVPEVRETACARH